MRKQILVIGGGLFAGRVFSILSSRGDELYLHIVNRGNHPLKVPNITQYVCDRHDLEKLKATLPPDLVFDAVVDFCAYEPTEITGILEALPGRIKQYIFLSTSSVYEPGDHGKKREGDKMLHDFSDDEVSAYILKKCLLELELETVCKEAGIPYTILRPAFIYGPFNYAPRESFFIQLIAKNKPVPKPTDATGKFSMVYVMDVSAIITKCIGNENAYNQIFNLSAPEDLDYDLFFRELERCNGSAFATQDVTVAQVLQDNIPLPFPLDENELYNGDKVAQQLGFTYTPFSAGMDKTFSIFKSVYSDM